MRWILGTCAWTLATCAFVAGVECQAPGSGSGVAGRSRHASQDSQRAMMTDLRDLAVTQERFFVDNLTYTSSLEALRGFSAKSRARIEIVQVSASGWSALATDAGSGVVCGIFVGNATRPLALAMDPGSPLCGPAALRVGPMDTVGVGIEVDFATLPEVGQSVALGRMLFSAGGVQLSAESLPMLERLASRLLASPPGARWEIGGYTDNRGAPSTNQYLSQERARATQDYLIRRGVSPAALENAGYGSQRPVAPNTTADGRARNRRIEIKRIQ